MNRLVPHERTRRWKPMLALTLLALLLTGPRPAVARAGPRALALRPPAVAAVSFLDDAAGLSAYFDAGMPINTAGNQLRNLFRTIETEGAAYFIGAMHLAPYSQAHDVKVFVHASGWVVAYYPPSEPASKVLDFEPDGSTTITTRFDKVLTQVAAAVGVSQYQVAYYDYRYPAATHLLLIGETRNGFTGTDTFQLSLPAGLTVLERSWYLRSANYPTARLELDGVTLATATGGDSQQGYLAAGQLVTDAPHTVGVHNNRSYQGDVFGGLAFVYAEP